LLAGFPCQAFSAVGKKEGFKDQLRGTIFFHIADIIESTRPKAFLLENVEGLTNHDKGKTFKVILNVLINVLDYHIVGIQPNLMNDGFLFEKKHIILNTKNFGLPQNRPRVYLVGFNKKIYGNDIKDLNFKILPQKRKKHPIYNDLNNVIEKKADKDFYLSEGYLNTLKKHKKSQKSKGNGFGYKVVNENGIDNPISNALLATGGSGKERNLIHDPQKEIYGLQVKNKRTPINQEGIRMMTPNEWAKLQGFKGYAFIENETDTFSFPNKVSKTQQYKQLGNSVSIPVIEELANMIIYSLNELEGV
jgi:DNA (cytosine-5)-methyltransferase 1